MKKTILVLFIIPQLLFTAVLGSDSPESATDQDKKETYTVTCGGTGKSWNDCYQEAEDLCPSGYTITKKSTGVISTPVFGNSTLAPGKKIVIECK